MIIQHEDTNTVLTEQDLIDIYMEGYNEGIQALEEKYEPSLLDRALYHRRITKEMLNDPKNRLKTKEQLMDEFNNKMKSTGNKRVLVNGALGSAIYANKRRTAAAAGFGLADGLITGKIGEKLYRTYAKRKFRKELDKRTLQNPM